VKDMKAGQVLEDLVDEGQKFVAARGGRGGRGNARFATSVNQAPRRVEKGEKGEERWLSLELKFLADVGLVGLPNVGKSTLISKISAAKPRVAEYPFTTLIPNLGVVRYGGEGAFVVADIPGMIQNAHSGSGLGTRFLRHIERTRLLIRLLATTGSFSPSPLEDYQVISRELGAFNPMLLEKPQVVVLNKIDLLNSQSLKQIQESFAAKGIRILPISALTGQGLDILIAEVSQMLEALAPKSEEKPSFEAHEHPT